MLFSLTRLTLPGFRSYLADGELLSDDAVVVLECDSADKKPEEIGKLVLRKRYTFSGVSFLVYIKRKENE